MSTYQIKRHCVKIWKFCRCSKNKNIFFLFILSKFYCFVNVCEFEYMYTKKAQWNFLSRWTRFFQIFCHPMAAKCAKNRPNALNSIAFGSEMWANVRNEGIFSYMWWLTCFASWVSISYDWRSMTCSVNLIQYFDWLSMK